MNVRDSEVIAWLLQKAGFLLVDDPVKADVVIFNTCSVRQHAEDKVWSEMGRIGRLAPYDSAANGRRIKTGGALRPTKKIVGLIGCMAQNYKEDIFRRAPQVDFVVGPADIDKIPEIIKKISRKGDSPPSGTIPFSGLFEAKIWETDGENRPEEVYHTGYHQDREHAFVVISEGCSNYCSYCVVPHTRGPLRHRAAQEILKEARAAAAEGISKITLLGQNVNAYDSKGVNFVRLVRLVDSVKGLKEFSFITSHPKDTSLKLFQAMADCAKLKKYLHLPLQSGSDRILKLMNRGYTRKNYLDLARDYRKIVKGGELTTDIIVGFPGEKEADFRATFDLVREAEFNAAYIFKYSPRPHTAAERLLDDVPREKKEKRHKLILDLLRAGFLTGPGKTNRR